jgi:hypothetical protein
MSNEVTVSTGRFKVTLTHEADVVTSVTVGTDDPAGLPDNLRQGLMELPTLDLSSLRYLFHLDPSNGRVVRSAGTDTPKGGKHRSATRRGRTPAPEPVPEPAPDTDTAVRERAYRQLTPAIREQILAAYAKDANTTVSGIGRDLGVPRWTAQAWVSRIRREQPDVLPGKVGE